MKTRLLPSLLCLVLATTTLTSCEALRKVYEDKNQSADKIDQVADRVTDAIRSAPPLPPPGTDPQGWLGWLAGLGAAAVAAYLRMRGIDATAKAEAATLHARVDARKDDLVAVEKRVRDLELGGK
jgi:hypothetical protein